MKYSLTNQDLKAIHKQALDKFLNKGLQPHETYDNFLTKCIVEAFITFTSSKNII